MWDTPQTSAIMPRTKNGEKVAHAAGQHEEMPDPMAVNKFFIQGVEDNSDGIEQSPGNQQGHARTRK